MTLSKKVLPKVEKVKRCTKQTGRPCKLTPTSIRYIRRLLDEDRIKLAADVLDEDKMKVRDTGKVKLQPLKFAIEFEVT